MSVRYIVDDQDPAIEYLCPVTHEKVGNNYFNGTYTTINSEECGGAWFKYSFNGTSVRLSNRVTPDNSSYAVQIDFSPMLKEIGNGTYQSPTLSDDKEHYVTYALGNKTVFPVFDYLTVTAGSSTQLRGKTIVVDDADEEIHYSGNWRTEPNLPSAKALFFPYTSSPYLNTTHWSNTVGDSFSFRFQGTSVAVYGVIPSSTMRFPGRNLTATYTIDNQSARNISIWSGNDENRPLAMSRLLLSDDLPAGLHTLSLNVTDIPDLSLSGFSIDMITYNASFKDLASMENGGVSPGTGAIIGDGHIMIWKPVLGVVLGLVCILLVVTGWLFKRRRTSARRKAQARARMASNLFVIPSLKDSEQLDYGKAKGDPL